VSDITLEALKLRERELELDAVLIRGRVLEIRNMIAEMERRRGGRPRKPAAGLTVINEPEHDEQGALPSIDDVRGILRTDPPEAAE
jgi:hypothetical protein